MRFEATTHALVIDDGDLFNPSITVEFVFKVAFLGADAESEDTENVRGIWLLLGLVNLHACLDLMKPTNQRRMGASRRRRAPPSSVRRGASVEVPGVSVGAIGVAWAHGAPGTRPPTRGRGIAVGYGRRGCVVRIGIRVDSVVSWFSVLSQTVSSPSRPTQRQ